MTPPPPPPEAGAEVSRGATAKGTESPASPAGARKPWVKPVLSSMHEMMSTGTGAKNPTPQSYEGNTAGLPAMLLAPAPFSQYGPFQNI